MAPVTLKPSELSRDSEDLFSLSDGGFPSTQMTLVNASPSQKRVPSSISRRKKHSVVPNPDPPSPEPILAPSPPRPLSPHATTSRPPEASTVLSTTQEHTEQPISPARQALSTSRRAALKTPQQPERSTRRKRKAVSPSRDVPARNTRARSRSISIEPSALAPPHPKKRRVQKELDVVPEAPQAVTEGTPIANDDPTPAEKFFGTANEPIPVIANEEQESASAATTNQADELDVEEQLVPVTTIGHNDQASIAAQEEEEEEELEDDGEHQQGKEEGLEDVRMDADDAQTDMALHNPPDERVSQHPPSFLTLFEATLEAELASHRTMTMRRSQPRNTRSSLAPSYTQLPASDSRQRTALAPPTPRPSLNTPQRKVSTSSAETFPFPGTRASAVKEQIQEKEKSTPYKPPAGTKAAKFMERADRRTGTQRVTRARRK